MDLLIDGGKSVNEIAAALQISQSGTSQHLSVLARAGVLVVEPRGSVRLYRIRGPRIARILALIEEFCTIHKLFGPEDPPESAIGAPPEFVDLVGGPVPV